MRGYSPPRYNRGILIFSPPTVLPSRSRDRYGSNQHRIAPDRVHPSDPEYVPDCGRTWKPEGPITTANMRYRLPSFH